MNTIEDRIKAVLATVRPAIQSHSGDLEYVSFVEGTVSIRLHGACVGCPISFYTVTFGIEMELKNKISEVKSVKLLQE